MPDFISHTLGFISKYKIAGIIPLNATLHLLISTLITIILLKKKFRILHIIFLIFLLGISKEILDCFVLNNTLKKHITDMMINLFYPTMVLIIKKIKGEKI